MQANHSSGRSKMKSDATSSTISERSSSGCSIGEIAAVALDLDQRLWLLLSRQLEFTASEDDWPVHGFFTSMVM
ncbi:hypothetical protein COP2_033291 [Malus domestica]